MTWLIAAASVCVTSFYHFAIYHFESSVINVICTFIISSVGAIFLCVAEDREKKLILRIAALEDKLKEADHPTEKDGEQA